MSSSISAFYKMNITNLRNPQETMELSSLWKDKPCVLLFLRRLGCKLCRSYAQDMEEHRVELENKGVRVVCLSFESFGEDSDFDQSFDKLKFWNGPIYKINKKVYELLFNKKGLFNGLFGLLDMDKEALNKANEKKIDGNLKGDGFQLGGQFVIDTDGSVKLDHRQKYYGDDAELKEIIEAIEKCKKN